MMCRMFFQMPTFLRIYWLNCEQSDRRPCLVVRCGVGHGNYMQAIDSCAPGQHPLPQGTFSCLKAIHHVLLRKSPCAHDVPCRQCASVP